MAESSMTGKMHAVILWYSLKFVRTKRDDGMIELTVLYFSGMLDLPEYTMSVLDQALPRAISSHCTIASPLAFLTSFCNSFMMTV